MKIILNITVLLLMITSCASARYINAEQLTYAENRTDSKRIEHVSVINVDNEDLSKELEDLSKRGNSIIQDAAVDYSQNTEEDKKRTIIRQLMFIIDNYQTTIDENVMQEYKNISEVAAITTVENNEVLNESNNMPKLTDQVSDIIQNMVIERDYLTQNKTDILQSGRKNCKNKNCKSQYIKHEDIPVPTDLPKGKNFTRGNSQENLQKITKITVKELTDRQMGRNNEMQSKASNQSNRNFNSQDSFYNKNDSSNKGEILQGNRNRNEKSFNTYTRSSDMDSVTDVTDSRNKIPKNINYLESSKASESKNKQLYDIKNLSKTIDKSTNENENTSALLSDKNELSKNTKEYDSQKGKVSNGTYQTEENGLQEEYLMTTGSGENGSFQSQNEVSQCNVTMTNFEHCMTEDNNRNDHDSNSSVISNTDVSTNCGSKTQGSRPCVDQNRKDEWYQRNTDKGLPRNNNSKIPKDKTKSGSETDDMRTYIFLSRDNLNNNMKKTNKYHVEIDKDLGKSYTGNQLFSDKKTQSMNHKRNYKGPIWDNVPFGKSRYGIE
ncbi:probable serine/threonine-protein kinase clkA [Ruditapes philippinarum]|uniref:probable serine/threonine-protein kinase clkA n=1 Tax=Ruditapes philippinarum TaxID=129788 RepID=UPI00295C0750|nr:probable serine/threonine-protein kinase clkA [Ruditapes philippinarum]